jgi:beta-mannosidase
MASFQVPVLTSNPNISSVLTATMSLSHHFHTLLFSMLSTGVVSQNVIDLSTSQWTLSNPVHNISIPGSVPSQAHLDLYWEGVIPDPYFGLGDFELRWVAYSNWTYEMEVQGL